MSAEIAVGSVVGAEYRDPPEHQPWLHAPHRGVVIERDDPRAWAGTIRFPGVPTRKEIRAHLAELAARGRRIPEVPVAWGFGRVYWEKPEALYLATSKKGKTDEA